jgi:DHA1 family tetracycline resistance protein-like MFS transporter
MSPKSPDAPARLRPGIAFILVVAALDVMSMGLVMPVLPTLIVQLTGSDSNAGWWTGVMVALWAAMQFLFSPVIGSLSDRFGRRSVILISTAGLAADWVLMALAPNLWWLVVGRIIGGITSSSFTAVFAYMADITPPEGRARAYGLVGAAFSAGFVIGPALGGLLGQSDPRIPFWVAGALSALAFLWGLLILPESLPSERRSPFYLRRANPFGALRLLSRPGLTRLASVNFLVVFTHYLFAAVFVLYAGRRYGWGAWEVGLLLAMAGALDVVVQSAFVGPVSKRIGERATMLIGLVLGAFGIAAMGLAPTGAWLVAATVLNAAWGLAMPTAQALMTSLVSEREQGQVQGANNSVGAIAGVLSPLAFGWAYGVTAPTFPGAVFLAAAFLLLGAAAVGLRVVARAGER